MGKVADAITCDIPDAMIDAQAQYLVENLARQIQSQGLSFEQYMQMTNTDPEKLKADAMEPALERLNGLRKGQHSPSGELQHRRHQVPVVRHPLRPHCQQVHHPRPACGGKNAVPPDLPDSRHFDHDIDDDTE